MKKIGLDYWLFGYFIEDEIQIVPKDKENIRFEWRYFDQWNHLHPKLKQSMNQPHMKGLFNNYSQPISSFVKGAESFTPPSSAVSNAKKGLGMRKKWGRGGLTPAEAKSQGIDSGITRARKNCKWQSFKT